MHRVIALLGMGILLSGQEARAETPAWPTRLDQATFESKAREISESKEWRRRVHYGRTMPFYKLKSRADNPEFFFAPTGASDPHAELLATVRGLASSAPRGKLKIHPQCAFPERFQFLKQKLELTLPSVPCPKVDEFLDHFRAQSASLIFSSAYANNPGSMFGHTFLKFTEGKRPEVLDYAISYAAYIGGDAGVGYMIRGVFGGYPGQFAMTPYYAKINEYNNAESRDIWEYVLNITPAETRTLLLHLWELETNTQFQYYFFDENCAFILLAAIEVARADWDISSFGAYAIPGETVKRLTETPNAIKEVKFRPALQKRMIQHADALSKDQRDTLARLISGESAPSSISDPQVLDAANVYFQFRKQEGKLKGQLPELQRAVLVQRSKFTSPTVAELEKRLSPVSGDTRPDLGHHSYRAGIAGGTSRGDAFQDLHIRSAYHDLLNRDLGYLPFSQIEFPSVTLRYMPERGTLNVEHINGLQITSLFPMSFLEKRLSWKATLDYRSPKDYGCLTCNTARFEGGIGATVELARRRWIVYGLGLLQAEMGHTLQRGFRFSPKAEIATIVSPFERWKIRALASPVTDLFQPYRQKVFYEIKLDQAYAFSQRWDARAELFSIFPTSGDTGIYREARLAIHYFF